MLWSDEKSPFRPYGTRRADVASSARIGAAAALTLVLLVLYVAVPDDDISPSIPQPLLGAILARLPRGLGRLEGREVRTVAGDRRRVGPSAPANASR
jgi:hypothetical protein